MTKRQTDTLDSLARFAQDLKTAIESARQLSARWLACRVLRGGVDSGPVPPYSQEAVDILEQALESGDEDGGLLHHLAIAYHAWAWDLETTDPAAAFPLWSKALDYWRRLKNRGDFWRQLEEKGGTLGQGLDTGLIKNFREDLVSHLLAVHVEFILFYYERRDRASVNRHVGLIKRARLAPAERKRFGDFVFRAMTSSVPNVVAEGRLDDAMDMLDDFLRIFPGHPPALQYFLEIAFKRVEQLSPSDHWEQIHQLDRRIESFHTALSNWSDLKNHPLAQTALRNIAAALGEKYNARARNLRFRENEESAGNNNKKDDGEEFYEEFYIIDRAVMWLEKYPVDEIGFSYWLRADYRLRHMPVQVANAEYLEHLEKIETDMSRALQYNPGNKSLEDTIQQVRTMVKELG